MRITTMTLSRLLKPVAIVLACALAGCQGTPTKPAPLRLGAAQSGSLTVKLAPGAGLRTQYLAVQDWEVAEGTLENATLGVTPVTVQAQAVVDPTTQTRTAALSFTGITPGVGYTLTVRLKRQDAAGTALVVAEASKAAIDLVVGPNTITWDQALAPRLESAAVATPVFDSYVGSLFGGAIAEFKSPAGLAFAPNGTLYVSDTGNHRLRALTLAGNGSAMTAIGTGDNDFANGLGPSAKVNTPTGVAFNAAGEMFIADRENNRIRKVTFDALGLPTVTTLAGGSAGFEDGNGSTAEFDGPVGLAFDGDGNLWVAERDNNAIRKIVFNLDGTVTVSTVAGTGAFGFSDGLASSAQFRNPQGIVYDPVHDHIIVADTGNNRIRVLHQHDDPPTIDTIAGLDSSGFADGDASTAKFSTPIGLAWGPDDCLYVADKDNHRIRRLTFASDLDVTVDTPAGTGAQGTTNGAGASAKFKSPVDLKFNGDGELFVAESGNHLIRKLVFDGAGNATVSTAAGIRSGFLEGPLTTPINRPQDAAMGADGALYVADTDNNQIGRVTFDGAGNASYEVLAGTTQSSFANGDGATARFDAPRGIVAGAPGEFFIADSDNHRIRRMTVDGSGNVDVSTVAGTGAATHADGDATTASFKTPQGICRDAEGNLFIADTDNHRIRKIVFNPDTTVTVSTVAGTGVAAHTDGAGLVARFNSPEAIAVGTDGTLYVADTSNHRIRAITFGDSGATVSTLAGTGSAGAVDGAGTTATLNAPSGIEVEASGNLVVGDESNHKIRRLTLGAEGAVTVSTVAGSGTSGFADGPGPLAQLSAPEGLTVGPDGRIYVMDKNKSVVRVIR